MNYESKETSHELHSKVTKEEQTQREKVNFSHL